MRGPLAVALLVAASTFACRSTPKASSDVANRPCATLDAVKCASARAFLAAIPDYGVSAGPFVIDASKPRVLGRGVAPDPRGGAWKDVGLACAAPTTAPASSSAASAADRAGVDHAFVAFVLDDAIVPPDEPLRARVTSSDRAPHVVRLVALALAHDPEPVVLARTSSLTGAAACTCGAATHVVDAAKLGALVAYDVDARALDDRVPLAAAFRAALVDHHATVRETRTGDLALEGLGRGHSIAFAIRALAPVAHALVPVSDFCEGALASPRVTPAPVDFGEAPYGHAVLRTAHIANPGPTAMRALRGTETIAIPPRSGVDLALAWTPEGDALGCETQTRDETIVFLRDGDAGAAAATEQAAVIHERIRTGRETVTDTDPIDSTTAPRGERDMERATSHDVACPGDFVVASCRAERRVCSDVAHDCSGEGYGAIATTKGNGCHFACKGPGKAANSAASCRFDAVTECRLACSPPRR